jgi:hypothetical protein
MKSKIKNTDISKVAQDSTQASAQAMSTATQIMFGLKILFIAIPIVWTAAYGTFKYFNNQAKDKQEKSESIKYLREIVNYLQKSDSARKVQYSILVNKIDTIKDVQTYDLDNLNTLADAVKSIVDKIQLPMETKVQVMVKIQTISPRTSFVKPSRVIKIIGKKIEKES